MIANKPILVKSGHAVACDEHGEIYATDPLGTCLVVVFSDSLTKHTGILQAVLPDSSIDPEKAKEQPCFFVDTGVPYLLQEMVNSGWNGHYSQLSAKLIGGAQVEDTNKTFNIGSQNINAARDVLSELGISIEAEEIGENRNRTVTIDVQNQQIHIADAVGKKTIL